MASAILALHEQLKSKAISCVDLVQGKLAQLKESNNNTANTLLEDKAINLAQKVDAKIANGETIGLLEGIPFGIIGCRSNSYCKRKLR